MGQHELKGWCELMGWHEPLGRPEPMGRHEAMDRREAIGRRIDRRERFTGLRADSTCRCTDVQYGGRRAPVGRQEPMGCMAMRL